MRRYGALGSALLFTLVGGPAGAQDQATVAGSFASVESLAEARHAHTATVLPDGRVLVLGGFGDFGTLASAEIYDPASRTFEPGGAIAGPRRSHSASALSDGQVLVAGGMGNELDAALAIEIYDPALGSATDAGTLIEARTWHSATTVPGGDVHLIGGFDAELDSSATSERWDLSSGESHAGPTMTTDRGFHTATLLDDGRILIVGGGSGGLIDGEAVASAELYEPVEGTFSDAGSMPEVRTGHSATRLADGRVLVVGGSAFDVATEQAIVYDSTLLWDPKTLSFEPAGTMENPRSNHAAALLDDGRVLVIGGVAGVAGDDSLASTEVWDPSTASFEPAGSMAVARAQPTATALSDGTVLVVGGFGGEFFESHALAEVWTPGESVVTVGPDAEPASALVRHVFDDEGLSIALPGAWAVAPPGSAIFDGWFVEGVGSLDDDWYGVRFMQTHDGEFCTIERTRHASEEDHGERIEGFSTERRFYEPIDLGSSDAPFRGGDRGMG